MGTLAPTIPGMAKSKPSTGSAKKANRTGRPLFTYQPDALMDAIDAFMADQRLRVSKTDIVELALQEFLRREGYWPPKGSK